MSASPRRMDALAQRYGQLLQRLVPAVQGLGLAGADLLHGGQWGAEPEGLQAALRACGWATSTPDKDLRLPLPGNATRSVLLVPLVSDSARLVGAAAVAYAPQADAAALADGIAPALECLRQELAAADAAARAQELQLLRTLNHAEPEDATATTFDALLAGSLRRNNCDFVQLLVPNRGLFAQQQRAGELPPAVAAEVAGLRDRLTALAGQLRRPLLIQGPGPRPDRSAQCRLLIIPQRLCQGRVEALLAYVTALESPPITAHLQLALQLGAARIMHRLEADLDRTTGLLNRTGLEEVLRRVRHGVGSLILVDLDRLHAINEVHGFDAGDRVIQEMARLLQVPLLPRGAYAARLHGGCFAVLLQGQEAGAATEVATQIQNAVGALRPVEGDKSTPVSVSCGVAEIRNLGEPLSKALVAAEVVLKLAKERGRSRIEVHVSENSSIIRRHDEVFAAADLREALRTRQIALFAQPIVSLRHTDAAPAFELLVRMIDPATGEVRSPQEFIAAAQRYQLLPAVDRYVVDSAFALLGTNRALLMRLKAGVSINISGQSVGDPEFADYFLKRLRESRVPPSIITVEITEQAAVTNMTQATVMMRQLREAGCGIALDDFGTGANSLAYLRSLPVTRIKIDGSFIKDILTNPRSEAAVRGIAQLVKNFGLDCVGEYVESAGIANKLRQLGIDKGQGYHFGRPEPLTKVLEDLQRQEFAELNEFLRTS